MLSEKEMCDPCGAKSILDALSEHLPGTSSVMPNYKLALLGYLPHIRKGLRDCECVEEMLEILPEGEG